MEKKNTVVSKLTRKPLYIFLLIGVVVSVTAVACGGHGRHFSPRVMERMVLGQVDDILDDIDATDAQRATFEAAAREILDEALEMKKSHAAHKKAALDALSGPTVDRDAVKTHIVEKFDRMEDFALRSADKILDAYETLDSDQRRIVLDKLAKHMEKH